MSVPFLDLATGHRELAGPIEAAVLGVIASGRFLEGPQVAAFEDEFARYCGARRAVAVGSGLGAIELSLRALGIGAGDEVVVPASTFVATWLAVAAVGAVPVPAEPRDDTGAVDVASVAAAIGPRTRALLPVHLYGNPVDLDGIAALADRHGLALVEDAAQAHGARYRGRRVGARSAVRSMAAFSFYPGKNLGAMGDGGAVVTDDEEVADRVRLLRSYGSRVRYEHEAKGTNCRLDEIQASILRVKLERLDVWNSRRRAVAATYREALADTPGLDLVAGSPGAEEVHHLFPVRTRERDRLRTDLAAAGVETLVHYPIPPHRSGAFADAGWGPGALPRAERWADEVVSLPIGPHQTDEQTAAVVAAVRHSAAGRFRPA